MRCHCPPDTGFEIEPCWSTEAAHNIQYLQLSRGETFCFFETWMPEQETNPRSLTFLAGTRTPTPPPPPPFGIVITYIQTHYLWIEYWFTVRGAAQHFHILFCTTY